AHPREDGRWLASDAWACPDVLGPLMAQFGAAAGFPGGDRRAVTSLWSRWHFWATTPPWVAALLLHGCEPVVTGVLLDAEHKSSKAGLAAQAAAVGDVDARTLLAMLT